MLALSFPAFSCKKLALTSAVAPLLCSPACLFHIGLKHSGLLSTMLKRPL